MDILSERAYQAWPSWAVVYEWENVISRELDIPIKLLRGRILGRIERKLKSIMIDHTHLYSRYHYSGRKPHLMWVMNAKGYRGYMYRNMIPIFLDFPSEMVDEITEATASLPMYWVTCHDIYQLLKAAGSKNVYYMPLSIADENVRAGYLKKSIDVIQFGRRNHVLHEYMLRYIEQNPEVEYVYQTEGGSLTYVSNQRGTIGKFSERQEYLDLLAECRISLVSSPGYDKSRDFGGVDFVTPRFYESAANQCLLVGRYTDNVEATNIGLTDICPNVGSYEEFSCVISHYLNDDISEEKYALSLFLKNNVTSRRAMYMKEILAEKNLL